MSRISEETKEAGREWLRLAPGQYPDGVIPAEMGGAWITEISVRTGCPQNLVANLAREMGVWASDPNQVLRAQGPAPVRSEPFWGRGFLSETPKAEGEREEEAES